MGQPIHSAVPSGGISVIPMIYRLQLGVPATCLKSDSFRVAAAFTLLLRPYRKYEETQSDIQAKPRVSRYHSIPEVLISTFAPPRESLNHGLTF
jgi:hypothetical protein